MVARQIVAQLQWISVNLGSIPSTAMLTAWIDIQGGLIPSE